MTKPSDQLATVELSLHTKIAAVEGFGDIPAVLSAFVVIIILCLLHLEVQVHAPLAAVLKDNTPLIQFAAIVMQFVITVDEWPNIVSISACVLGQKGKVIAALA